MSVGRKPVVPKRRCARRFRGSIDRRLVVEEHAAAAVDLRVDETRQQQTGRPDRGGRRAAQRGVIAAGHDMLAIRRPPAARRRPSDEPAALQHAAVDRAQPHHTRLRHLAQVRRSVGIAAARERERLASR